MKFEIGIPTLNRADLLIPTLLLYRKDFPDTKIHILDNGKQGLKERYNKIADIEESETNIGVAASWNFLCDKIFQTSDYALILNDDVYMRKNAQDIEDIITKKQNKGCFLRMPKDWCAFILSKKIWEKVGRFDEEFFPAYYEDKSYEYRMKLAGVPMTKTPSLIPYIYKSSMTIDKDASIYEASKINKQRYIDMWGGEPTQEKFKTPKNIL